MIKEIMQFQKIQTSGESIINYTDVVVWLNGINNTIQDSIESKFFNKKLKVFERYLKTAYNFNLLVQKVNKSSDFLNSIFIKVKLPFIVGGEQIIDRDKIDYSDYKVALLTILLSSNDFGNQKFFDNKKIDNLFDITLYKDFIKQYLIENKEYVEEQNKLEEKDRCIHKDLDDFVNYTYDMLYITKSEKHISEIQLLIQNIVEYFKCMRDMKSFILNSDFVFLSRKINKMIVFESKDKSGKSTLSQSLADLYFTIFKIQNKSEKHKFIDPQKPHTHISRFATPQSFITNFPPKEGPFSMTDEDYKKFKIDGKYNSSLQLAILSNCVGNDVNVKKILDGGFLISDRSMISAIVYSINADVEPEIIDHIISTYKKLSTSNILPYIDVHVFYLKNVFGKSNREESEYEEGLDFDKLDKIYTKVYQNHCSSEYGSMFSDNEFIHEFKVGSKMNIIVVPKYNLNDSDLTEEEKSYLVEDELGESMKTAISINSDVMDLFSIIESHIDHAVLDDISLEEYKRLNLEHIKDISDKEEI